MADAPVQVIESRDYARFKHIDGNRDVSERHVDELVESIQSANFLPNQPIIVNENDEIIDGQHRFAAAERLKIPFFYTVARGARISHVGMMNSKNRAWTLLDFVESYAKQGKKDYKELLAFAQKHILPLGIASRLLMKSSLVETGKKKPKSFVSQSIKDGTFIINNEKEALEILEWRKNMLDYVEDSSVKSDPSLMNALVYLYNNEFVDRDFLLLQMGKSDTRIPRKGDQRSYIFFFEEVYNHGRRSNTRVRLM